MTECSVCRATINEKCKHESHYDVCCDCFDVECGMTVYAHVGYEDLSKEQLVDLMRRRQQILEDTVSELSNQLQRARAKDNRGKR